MKQRINVPELFKEIMKNDQLLEASLSSPSVDLFETTALIKRKKELIGGAERFLKHNTDKGAFA